MLRELRRVGCIKTIYFDDITGKILNCTCQRRLPHHITGRFCVGHVEARSKDCPVHGWYKENSYEETT